MTASVETSEAAPERRASDVARNALSGGGRHVISAILALAVTPYALGVLGPDRFGVWVLAGTVLLTVRTFDLGLERALVRAVARSDGAGRRADARPALIIGRGLLVAAAIVFAAIIAAAHGPIVGRLLEIPDVLRPEAVYAIVGTAAVAVVEAWFRPLSAALDGVGRMDRSRGIDALQRILSSVGVVIVLGLGFGLRGLVWKNVATALFAGVLYARALRGIAPELRGRASLGVGGEAGRDSRSIDVPAGTDPRAVARELLGFGGHVQAVGMSALAYDVWIKVILGRVAGLGAVALYEIGARVVVLVAGTLQAAAEAIFPEASARAATSGSQAATSGSQGATLGTQAAMLGTHATTLGAQAAAASRSAAAALHARAGRAIGWLAMPAFGLLFVLALPFATAWLGPDHAEVGGVIRVLCVGWAVAILSAPTYLIAQASGRAADGTAAAAVTAIVAMALGAALVGRFGALGAAAAVSIGLSTGSLLMWWRFARAFGTGWSIARIIDLRAVVATALAMVAARGVLAGLAALAAWATSAALRGSNPSGGPSGTDAPNDLGWLVALADHVATSLPGVIVAGIVGGGVYVVTMLAVGAIGPEERRLLGRYAVFVPRIKRS